jgi:hypothetical protein
MITRLGLVAALCAVASLPACTATERAQPDARRTPAAVPTAAATGSVSPTPAPDEIDLASSEQLLLNATARLTLVVDGRRTSVVLRQNPLVDSVLEQTAGEKKRVVRLWTADAKRPAAVAFSLEGVAARGSFKTGEGGLKVALLDDRTGVDLLSDDGSCQVIFSSADASGARGTVSCDLQGGRDEQVSVRGTFEAKLSP